MNKEYEQFEKKKLICYTAGLVACFIAGLGYTWSVVQTPFVERLNAQDKVATVALCYTVTILFSTMSPTLFGRFTRRLSPRQLVLAGGILFGLGYLGCGYINSIPMLFLFYAFGTGIGAGLMYPTLMGYAASALPEKQGFASGLMSGIYGGAAVIWSPVLANMLQNSYTATWNIIGIICLVGLVLCGFLISPIPEGYVEWKKQHVKENETIGKVNKNADNRVSVPDLNRGQMVKTSMFYVAAVTFAFGLTSGMMVISQTSQILQSGHGMTPTQAAVYVSLMSFMSMAGRILWGALTDKTDKYITLSIICAIPALTMGLLSVTHSTGISIACMALTALCYGGFGGTITPITADLFGSKYITENYGVMYLMFGIAGLIGPRVAVSLNQNGDYSRAFMVGCVLAVISLAASLVVRKKVKG